MTVITHEALGRLEFDDQGVADTHVALGDRHIDVDVNFEGEIDAGTLDQPARAVANIADLDQRSKDALREDLAEGDEDGAVPLYKAHHLDEIEPNVLKKLFSVAMVEDIDDDTFLGALKLIRVGIYPDSEDATIVCDYSIDPDATNYLVSVVFDSDGELVDVTLES
jgi:hypothetical protein